MTSIKDLIEKIINPPGMLKKNRRALFDTIRDIGELVKKDALTAFNAHFPYLADAKKLQEHGDALLIPHLLHDTEKEYRERVATASFFLTLAGERQYIMGQLEERFKTRYSITEAFLDIHLRITDLTDDERAWALELLDSLLNPVIATELSEWYHYIDDVIMTDEALYNAQRQDVDFFDDAVLRDGRILRDGKTSFNKTLKMYRNGIWERNGRYGRSSSYTFPETDIVRRERRNSRIFRDEILTSTQKALIRRDGVLKRDGRYKRFGFYEIPQTDILRIYSGSAYRDPLFTAIQAPMADEHVGSPPRDGSRIRDGSYSRGYVVAFDELSPFYAASFLTETVPAEEQYAATVYKPLSDTHKTSGLRDGSRLRNGALQRGNIQDESFITYRKPMSEKMDLDEKSGETYTITPLVENAPINETTRTLVVNDYAETHNSSIRRNGAYPRNGLLQRANIQDTAGMRYRTAATIETAQYRVFRNGMAKRDGSETRSGLGSSALYEDNRAMITMPVEKEVLEGLDAAFQSAIKNNARDLFKNVRKRDGSFLRKGAIRRSNFIIDASWIVCEVATMWETVPSDEVFSVGMRKHLLRDGLVMRDGSGQRNNNVLIPLVN